MNILEGDWVLREPTRHRVIKVSGPAEIDYMAEEYDRSFKSGIFFRDNEAVPLIGSYLVEELSMVGAEPITLTLLSEEDFLAGYFEVAAVPAALFGVMDVETGEVTIADDGLAQAEEMLRTIQFHEFGRTELVTREGDGEWETVAISHEATRIDAAESGSHASALGWMSPGAAK